MKPVKRMQWSGVAVAAAGAALMGYSGPLSHAWTSAHLPTGLPVGVDWLLLIGILTIVGGGLLAQITWNARHG